jgi:hypothetical protein
MKEIVKMVICSHKRAEKVDTLKTIANCSLCVPESQAKDYEFYNKGVELIVHPDTVVGLSAKYRWVHEHYKNVCLLDDDLNKMSKNYVDAGMNESNKIDPELAYEIIQSTAFTAREAGCYMFGFSNSARPLEYSSLKPFNMTGFCIGGSIGLLDGFNMVLPDACVSAADYFLSAVNAHFHRKAFINRRYAFTSKEGTFKSTGGMANFRTNDTEKNDYYLLKEYFGNAVQIKKSTSMRKSLQNKYERILRIPY